MSAEQSRTKVDGARAVRDDPALVQSLTRALTLLEVMASRSRSWRLKELTSITKLPPSTVHRLLTTMEERRFVRFDRDEATWSIGSACFVAGAGFLRPRNFVVGALPLMHRLAKSQDASVNLGVMEGGQLILVEQVVVPGSETVVVPSGSRLPIHASALGKVMLSCGGMQRREAVAVCGDLMPVTDRTIVAASKLNEELHSVRNRGFAVDDEESGYGKRCVAAPIFDAAGRCVAAISIASTKSRLADPVLPTFVAAVVAVAERISAHCAAGAAATG